MNKIQSSSLLGENSKFHGEILFDNILHLDGHVVGKILPKSHQTSILLIGKNAIVEADVVADIIIVSGQLIGKVYAPIKLEIKKEGKYEGMVFTSDLVIQKKSFFHGQSFMIKHLSYQEKDHIKISFTKKKDPEITPNLLEDFRYPDYDKIKPKNSAKKPIIIKK